MNWTHLFRSWRGSPRTRVSAADNEGVSLILITTDSEFRMNFERIASNCNWTLDSVSCIEEGRARLCSGRVPLVVYDWESIGEDWRDGLSLLASMPGRRCIFLASRAKDNYLWEELIRYGGYDVLVRSAGCDEIRRDIAFAWFWTKRSHAQLDAKKETPHS